MLGGASRLVSRVVSWVVLAIIVAATTAGLIDRYLTPGTAPYPLLTREVGDHPLTALAFLVLCAAAYAVVFSGLRHLVAQWRDGATSAPALGDKGAKVMAFVDWTFAHWWRVSLVLALFWLPWYLSSFPGQPSPDPSNMITEFVSRRSDFAGAPAFADGNATAPFVDYPTSSYLLTGGDSLWSNHHPFFLMLGYGAVCSLSIAAFDSLIPALLFLSAASAVLTLVAFGRALGILGTLVPSWRVRGLALLVLALSPLIALWSMAEHKNQIFCAAFVWWLALIARLVHSSGPTRQLGRRWYVETALVSLLMAISVQFGWIVLVAQTVAMLFMKRERVAAVVAIGVPAVLVYGSIAALTSSGALIPSDPIETKGVQMQVLALVLTEHPDALSTDQRQDLSQIFDLDAFVASFDPSSSDPLKSTGPLSRKSASFKYETVQADDWDTFNTIVLDVAGRYPDTAVDGLFLKSYRYLDPFDEGTDWYPPWSTAYDRSIDGYRVAPLPVNEGLRGWTRDRAFNCYAFTGCRAVISHDSRTVLVVLLLAAAIGCRRRFAWLWALPFALQLAIAGVSPLSAGGRYVLAFTYGLAIVLMLLAIEDRPRREPDPEQQESEPQAVGR